MAWFRDHVDAIRQIADALTGNSQANTLTNMPSNLAQIGGTAVAAMVGLGGSAPVGDVSTFTTETTVLLGSSATFTGALHDGSSQNWFGAKAFASLGTVTGNLFIDESSASSAANIYSVTTAAFAAGTAVHGSPSTATPGVEARIAMTKTVLRWLRVVLVNGATAMTGTMEVQSALSPLN